MSKNKQKLIKMENDSYNERRNAIPRYAVILKPKVIEYKECGYMFFEALDELARTILITARPTKKNTIKSGLKRGSIISYYKSYGFNYLMDIKEELQNVGCTEGSSEAIVDMFKFEDKNIPEFIMKNAERIKTNLGRLKDENKELYIKVFLNNSILLM